MPQNNYLKYLYPRALFNTRRTRDIFQVNPTVIPHREEAEQIQIQVFDFSADHIEEKKFSAITTCFPFRDSHHVSWINIDGIRKQVVEQVCGHFGIHYLITEDILSVGQRPKMDEIDPILFCLLNMLYFNDTTNAVETEHTEVHRETIP